MSNLPPEQATAKSSLICADCGHEEWQHHPFTVMRTCSAMVDLRHAAAGGPLSPCPCKGFDAVTVVKVAAQVPVQIQGSPYRVAEGRGLREALHRWGKTLEPDETALWENAARELDLLELLEGTMREIAESYPWEPYADDEVIRRPGEPVRHFYPPTNRRLARERLATLPGSGSRESTLEQALRELHNEVDCRIEHGAESGGHLEYVRDRLAALREQGE